MSEFAFIDYRDSIVGRQAYIQGSSLAVWEVAMILRAYGGDIQKAAEHLHWQTERVQAAANYAAAFPAQIEASLADNDSYDAEKVRRMLPQTRVFTIRGDTLVEETPGAEPVP